MFWTNVAHAMGAAGEAGAEGGGAAGMASLLPIVLVFAIIYFLMIRPQHKRDQEHKAMIRALKPGDRVMTAGGIYGTLLEVNDETVLLDVGNNTSITVNRQSVGSLRPKGKVSKEERRSRRERRPGADKGANDEPADNDAGEFAGQSFDSGLEDKPADEAAPRNDEDKK